ncbi:hypothetical protein C5167_050395 [Papaver somniferum]|uniref:Uncharacterized protein n=1 Tax=Papaver somniferum TaxID=3469 RepID=A0A4Y7KNJ6_PAPSO|nr:hypothetical protein C5167_050395 [Papaver somniferum]
MLTTISKVHS